jgi:hypothetical protein
VVTQVVLQLSNPRPRDSRTTRELGAYKGLDARWQDWDVVRAALGDLALAVSS